MKQIISDYIHCTQTEFLLKHPFVVLGMLATFIIAFLIVDYIKGRGKK